MNEKIWPFPIRFFCSTHSLMEKRGCSWRGEGGETFPRPKSNPTWDENTGSHTDSYGKHASPENVVRIKYPQAIICTMQCNVLEPNSTQSSNFVGCGRRKVRESEQQRKKIYSATQLASRNCVRHHFFLTFFGTYLRLFVEKPNFSFRIQMKEKCFQIDHT